MGEWGLYIDASRMAGENANVAGSAQVAAHASPYGREERGIMNLVFTAIGSFPF